MLKLTFNQTPAERLTRIAASVVFDALQRKEKHVPLASVTEPPQYGFTASAASEPVGPRFVRITDLQDGRIDWDTVPYCECADPTPYLLKSGDLLFARTGATTGKTHLVTEAPEAVFASYLIRVRPLDGIDVGFLYSFFQSDLYWSQIAEQKEGSAQPNVNGRKLSGIVLPLPEPRTQQAVSQFIEAVRLRQADTQIDLPSLPGYLAEQRRIVAKIDELAAKIAEARQIRLLSERGVDKLRASASNDLFQSLRDQSATVPLGEVSEIQSGVTLGRDLTGTTVALPYLRVANVQDGRLDLGIVKTVTVLATERHKWQLIPGDILLTEGGDWDKLGRGTVWQGEIPDCIHQNHIFRVRLPKSRFDPRYVVALTGSPYGRAYFADASKQTTNLASINQRQLKAFPIFQISPAEQRRIVAYLDALLPAILDKAFKGEL